MSKVRTRFAPSPTGRMHVGNLRTALYAYLIARHAGGDFILRIEDTDQERQVEGAEEIIYNTLKKAGMNHDEGPDIDGGVGPYVQSERQAQGLYLKYAKELIDKGEAYYCFCDQERLDTLKVKSGDVVISHYDKHCLNLSKEEVQAKLDAGVPYVIRQNNPTEGTTSFVDEIYGEITVDNIELDDMILIKSDGYPTYNFANVVDDHLMGITHVVRGNEYLSSTPKYNRLYDAFGWEKPVYIHCPLITDEEHHKLSKRKGHSSFEDLIEQGFLPETIVNFVALLGWSPGGEQEIFSLKELEEIFDYKHMSKTPAVFDMNKIKWMNGEYSNTLQEVKGQVDEKAETWRQSADPSKSWTTTTEKTKHKGDLWYNTTEQKSYIYNGSTWEAMKAEPPSSVYDSIDGKAQIFVNTPKPPYDVGDLWFNDSTSDIMTCVTGRKSGNYVSSDWQKRNKYTDNTAVDDLNKKLNQEEIFNRLTNNGVEQGVYMKDGKLYLNFHLCTGRCF